MIIAGKSVVVTGGGNGIGRALAERFAAEGARGVTVADIDAGWAHKVAERIGVRSLGVGCDVSDPDAIGALVSAAEACDRSRTVASQLRDTAAGVTPR